MIEEGQQSVSHLIYFTTETDRPTDRPTAPPADHRLTYLQVNC
jgi:hypothetical protein